MIQRIKRKYGKMITKIIIKIGILLEKKERIIAKELLPNFANNPKNFHIKRPRQIIGADRIYVGDNVSFGPNCFLYARKEYSEPLAPLEKQRQKHQSFNPEIHIGNRVDCSGASVICAHDKIVIEDDVMIANNVYICDGEHGHLTAEEPYRYQEMGNIKPILIKRGAWLGKNVVIMPGVTIGENSIISANSVVNNDIPDKCIAIGAPARVIKKWDEENKCW